MPDDFTGHEQRIAKLEEDSDLKKRVAKLEADSDLNERIESLEKKFL